MKTIFLIAALAARPSLALDADPAKDCQFVAWWANKAFHISHTIGLDEDKWQIVQDGFPPEIYAVIAAIKHEAYHDLPALQRRVETVCAEKSES